MRTHIRAKIRSSQICLGATYMMWTIHCPDCCTEHWCLAITRLQQILQIVATAIFHSSGQHCFSNRDNYRGRISVLIRGGRVRAVRIQSTSECGPSTAPLSKLATSWSRVKLKENRREGAVSYGVLVLAGHCLVFSSTS